MADKATKSTADIFGALRKIVAVSKGLSPEELEGIEDVTDIYSTPDIRNQPLTPAEILVGPSEEASGDGAFKMVKEYSDVHIQPKLVQLYAEMSNFFEKTGVAMKAHDAKLNLLATAIVEKAQPSATNDVLAKAESRLKAATAALRKAEMSDDEDDKEDKEEALEKAERMLTAAKKLIQKAESENEDEMDDNVADSCEKALSTFKKLSKALVKAKSDMPVAKAEDESEEDGEKKDDEKEAMKSQIAILETTVKGFMDSISGTSKTPALPDFVKAMPSEDVDGKIEAAFDDSKISEGEFVKAKDLLARVEAAKRGAYDHGLLQQAITAAPEKVRAFFNTAA